MFIKDASSSLYRLAPTHKAERPHSWWPLRCLQPPAIEEEAPVEVVAPVVLPGAALLKREPNLEPHLRRPRVREVNADSNRMTFCCRRSMTATAYLANRENGFE